MALEKCAEQSYHFTADNWNVVREVRKRNSKGTLRRRKERTKTDDKVEGLRQNVGSSFRMPNFKSMLSLLHINHSKTVLNGKQDSNAAHAGDVDLPDKPKQDTTANVCKSKL